jgi:hypothetical protein
MRCHRELYRARRTAINGAVRQPPTESLSTTSTPLTPNRARSNPTTGRSGIVVRYMADPNRRRDHAPAPQYRRWLWATKRTQNRCRLTPESHSRIAWKISSAGTSSPCLQRFAQHAAITNGDQPDDLLADWAPRASDLRWVSPSTDVLDDSNPRSTSGLPAARSTPAGRRPRRRRKSEP